MTDRNRYLFPSYLVILLLLAGSVLGLMVWTGRSRQGWTHAPNEIVFTGWGDIVEKAIFQELCDTFEREHPGARIRYIQIPQNYMQKLQIMMAGGTPPDVFYIFDGDFPGFVSRNMMEPLEPWVQRSDIVKPAEYWPSGISRFRYNGRAFGEGPLYALPKGFGPLAMFYNRDIFRRAGVPYPSPNKPMTWDEATRMWVRLTRRDRTHPEVVDQYGIAGLQAEDAAWSNGGEIVSEDGRRFVAPDDPHTIEAFNWVRDLSLKYRCSPSPRETVSMSPGPMFDTGKLACLVAGKWNIPHYRTLGFDWDVAPPPVSPRTRKQVGWSGCVGLAMSRSCRNKELAWKFIEFVSGPAGQTIQLKSGFDVPNQRYLAKTDAFRQPGNRPAHPEVFIPIAENARPGLMGVAPTTEWMNEYQQRMHPMWSGDKEFSTGLKRIQPIVQAALDRSWKDE